MGKKSNKSSRSLLRTVLMLVLVAALVYVGARMMQGTGQTQSASPAEPTGQLTLLTDAPRPTAAPEPALTAAPAPTEEPLPSESGSYTDVDDVAYYLHTYGHLPDNYITKNEAQDAGWVSHKGNLWDVAYGMSIGGDRYGNYDGQLPKGEKYYEADVNYDGGYRGEERIVYTEDGDVWYTSDHYESFEKLY